jgi:hypothetical protein
MHDYRYRQNGTKKLKTNSGLIKRIYYKCVVVDCLVKMREDITDSGAVSCKYFGKHNHPRPKTPPPPDKQKKAIAKQMLLFNMKPSEVQKELLLSSKDPISARYLPTRIQLSNMLGSLKRRYLPSHDALHNIMTMYHNNFLLDLKIFPQISIILGAPEARQLFQLYGRTVFVDGTFDLCEGKIILTTLMLLVDGIGVPVFFLLSENRSTKAYQYFLRQLVDFTENSYTPEHVVGDYETALQHAVQIVFPTVRYFGDSFHFFRQILVGCGRITSIMIFNVTSSHLFVFFGHLRIVKHFIKISKHC